LTVTGTSTLPTISSTSSTIGALKATTTTIGALYVAGSTASLFGNGTLNIVKIEATQTSSTTINSGSLVVTGGVGISENVYIGGNLTVTGASGITVTGTSAITGYVKTGDLGSYVTVNGANTFTNTNSFSKAVSITSTTISISSTSGALIVTGGVGISGAVNIGGGLTVTGTSAIAGYVTLSGNNSFTNYNSFSQNVSISSSTSSTDTTSGALVVTGGVGISGVLRVAGNIYSNLTCNAASFNATSDYRTKKNIEPINDSFTLTNLKPIIYDMILPPDSIKERNKRNIGFLAHELQEHYPYLVYGEKDEVDASGNPMFQSINYNGLIGILVYEIQKLKQNDETKSAQITELQQRTNLLQQQVKQLLFTSSNI
jgi:hypothetical protein